MKKWIDILKKTYQEWADDNCLQIGAALSFYTLSSLIPLLLVITSIFTYVLFFTQTGSSITDSIVGYVSNNVSAEFGSQVETILNNRSQDLASGSIISAIIGFVTLLFTASGVFGQLDAAFDVIWDVPDENKPSGIWGTIKAKIFSFGMVLAVAFILLVSTILTSVITSITGTLSQYIPGGGILIPVVNFAVQLALISLVFMLLFKYLPNVKVEWRDVALGGVLTAVLWIIGQLLLSFYFSTSSFSSYGVIGGVLAFLVYIYYSSQIVFFGGEFTQAYARTHGSRSEEAMREKGITPAGVLMAQAAATSAGRIKSQQLDEKEQALAAARTKQYAAAATGGMIGLVGGALIGGIGLVAGLTRGVAKLRGR